VVEGICNKDGRVQVNKSGWNKEISKNEHLHGGIYLNSSVDMQIEGKLG
jgi:hypothetical protein